MGSKRRAKRREAKSTERTMADANQNVIDAALEAASSPIDNQAADEYSTPLQIAGVFIIVAASISGMGESIFGMTLEVLKGCGLGVIICTSLIHLIGEAYLPFEQSGMADTYEQWPMVFAMVGMFIMAILEFFHHRFE